jgi:predicted amidohydrolase
MKIAIAQINTSIGAFSKNRDKIINAYEKAKKIEADLVVFPELTITGYPPKDLLFNKSFIYESHYQLNKLISHISKPAAIIGYVRENNTNIGKPFFNSAAFIYNKTIKKIINKILIPSYDVFDEDRYFEPGKKTTFINDI